MNILVVTQYFWPETFCINELSASLHARGHKIDVLTGIPNYPGGKFFEGYGWFRRKAREYRGLRIRRVPIIPRGEGGALRLMLNYASFVFFSCLLGPWLCAKNYDLILVYEPSPITVCLPALLLKWLRGIPVIFWVQDLWPESLSATGAVRSPFFLRMVGRLVRFIYRRCDRILVQSEAFRESVEHMGAKACTVEYFPNSADSFYQPVALEQNAAEMDEMPAGFRVLFAGNVGAAQDFDTILNAAERLKGTPDIKWVIIGDGRLRSWVETEVLRRGLGKTVSLLGWRSSDGMPRYIAAADVMLVTLRKDPIFALTIPTKIQAYLACGKPIIGAIDGEGARIVLDANAGLTCPAEEPALLAQRVLEMYGMQNEQRQLLGANARRYFEAHFESQMLLDRLETIMEHVVGRDVESSLPMGSAQNAVGAQTADMSKME
jgi:glycosyltransferase involved in cell wall biosynthesis